MTRKEIVITITHDNNPVQIDEIVHINLGHNTWETRFKVILDDEAEAART